MACDERRAEAVRTRDGRTLHLERRGSGTPVVVFEAGLGASRSWWGAVAPAVARRTTTAVYDRSGLGRSPVAPGPRGLAQLVDDLVDVLDHLGDGPFVLVAHSWGGPIVRVAAASVPDCVAGLVLVDQSDERCELFFSRTAALQEPLARLSLPVLDRLGVLRRMTGRLAAGLPEDDARALREEGTSRDAVRTQLAELRRSTDDLRQLRADPPVLPDVPVTLVSGTRSSPLGRRRRTALLAAHRASAGAVPQGRHVTADRSAHLVPLTEPGIVADEVVRVVDIARGAGR
jgi:pimeloyl-ACP methyl ester carboxylesterase